MYFNRISFFVLLVAIQLLGVETIPIRAQSNQPILDSLENVLDDAKGADRFNTLFELFRLNMSNNKEEAQQYARKALEVAISLRDTMSIVKSNNAIGYINKEMGYHRNAIPYFETALKLAREKKYSTQVKFLLNNLGLVNAQSANYAKALDYHLESLKIRETEGDTISISVALNNIGVLYQEMEDYENAFTYYKKNYDLKVKAKEYNDFDLCLINLADVSNALEKHDDAKKYLREVFDRCSDNAGCDKRQLALAHNAMGYSFLNTADLVHAEQEFFIATNLFSELKSPDRADTYHALALVRYRMGDYAGALDKLNIAQTLAAETEIPKYQLKNYKLYGDIFSQQKDFKKASEFQQKFIDLNDKIFNADLIKSIARVQTEHQEAENMRTIAAQDQEILTREELFNVQRNQVISISVIAFLVCVLAGGAFYMQNTQSKSNLELKKAKRTIEVQNSKLTVSNVELDNLVTKRTKELHSSNEQLKKVNDELDNFIYKTSHDIRGPLASLKGITNLALREAKEDMLISYLNKLDLTADKLNKVLTRLQIINQINHTMLVPKLIDFNLMIEEILDVERKRGIPPNLSINLAIDDGIIMFSDEAILKIVLENLIDNAFKFYNASDRKAPFVKITILSHDNGVTIKVLDNGIGIKAVAPTEIFKMFVRASERSQAGGIGLYLAKISTEKLGGSIALNITEEEYTEFSVQLPSDLREIIRKREELELQMKLGHL